VNTPPYRTLLVIALVALAHAAVFTWYQRPDWESSAWSDQVGYERLGHALATTGTFTRNPDVQPFIPETLRTPMYPLFIAAIYRIAGESRTAIAMGQAILFAALTLVVYAMTAWLATERVALAAAWFTALFSPIPYYGALALTDVLCTFLVTLTVWASVRAVADRRRRDYILTGLFAGLATLTRPTFALLPFAIIASVALVAAVRREWRTVMPWIWTLAVYALVLSPWLAYNVVYVHRLTLTPAGGVGRATWEASWQGTWSGGVQADLTRLVADHMSDDDAALDARVRQFAAERNLPAEPMIEYVHQWRDIRLIWDTPTDPRERATKRIEADDRYWSVGVANIARAPANYVTRRLTVGAFVLWAGEIPIRYTSINSVRRIYIRAMWLVQAGLFALAIIGLVMFWHRRGLLAAAPLAALVVYVTVVHLPMLAEARYSLPAKPTLLALVAIALAEIMHRALPQTGDYLP
jgi:4-amino-4-deoxy-L-arabinose transferase-like glycosyltransferase